MPRTPDNSNVVLSLEKLEHNLEEVLQNAYHSDSQVYSYFYHKETADEDKKRITKTLKQIEDRVKLFKKESDKIVSKVKKTLKNNRKVLTSVAKKAKKKNYDHEGISKDLDKWISLKDDSEYYSPSTSSTLSPLY